MEKLTQEKGNKYITNELAKSVKIAKSSADIINYLR